MRPFFMLNHFLTSFLSTHQLLTVVVDPPRHVPLFSVAFKRHTGDRPIGNRLSARLTNHRSALVQH